MAGGLAHPRGVGDPGGPKSSWEGNREPAAPGAGSGSVPHQEQLRLSHTRYLQQHPDAEALVSDFLLFLLLRQPDDVVTFAAEFFGPFSARYPRVSPLRSSNRPSPFRSLEP